VQATSDSSAPAPDLGSKVARLTKPETVVPTDGTAVPVAPVVAPVKTQAPKGMAASVAAISEAQRLNSSGRVLAARGVLEKAFAETANEPSAGADVAFALARTYDAGHLAKLGKTDAAPDAAIAERWYRRWYELSVKAGTVSDGIRLERLIQSVK
jgi:hypothetical protein